jgi:hypothetical protein
LVAFGGFVYRVVNVGEEFAGGNRAVFVGVGFAVEAFE